MQEYQVCNKVLLLRIFNWRPREGTRAGAGGNDDEISGDGNSQDHMFRSYDPRLGRYKSLDPLFRDYPWNSPYAYAENDVIRAIDLEGREKFIQTNNVETGRSNQIELPSAGDLGSGVLHATEVAHGVVIYEYQEEVGTDGSGGRIGRVNPLKGGAKVTGKLMSNQSTLSNDAKAGVMTAVMYQGQHNAIKNGVDISAYMLSETGEKISDAGLVVSTVNPVAGGALIGAGEVIEDAGLVLEVVGEIMEKDITDLSYMAAVEAATYVAEKKLKKMVKADQIGDLDRVILEGVTRATEETADVVKDEVHED